MEKVSKKSKYRAALSILTCLLFILPSVSQSQKAFKDITDSSGIDHVFQVFEGMFGGGACVIDYDNDGYDDLYITSGVLEDKLYKNNGDGTFQDVHELAGLGRTHDFVTQGVASADVNRDGFDDLLITTITTKHEDKLIPRAINLLFLNQGDGTFKDQTEAFGLGEMNSFSTAASFGDFNADGFPDLFIANYFNEFTGELSEINDATIVGANQISKAYLLENKEGRFFEDVYEKYGLDFKGFGFGGVFTDFDKDGDQDLIINHDFGFKRTPNLLLENQFPKEQFINRAEELEMDLKINSMGTAVGDFNGDGSLDYLFTNIRFNKFMSQMGNTPVYTDILRQVGMNFFSISWGANFADFDHDGDLDLFVSNGDLNPNCVPMGNFYYENLNQTTFKEKSREVGLNDYGIGRGSVFLDIENDGDLDLLVINQSPVLTYPTESRTKLYRNDGTEGKWLKVRLKGLHSESKGIGSRVEVVVNGSTMVREVDGGGSSHLSQNAKTLHFGLSKAPLADSVIVYWASGQKQVLLDVKAQQTLEVQEETLPSKSPYFWYLVILPFLFLIALLLRKRI